MRQPNFLFEEFLDNNALNTAFQKPYQSLQAIGTNINPYFLPGVINPSNIIFTFNNNLTVTVNPQNSAAVTNAVGCLFSNGSIVASHGTTNGTDNSTVIVSFASLVPGAGSVTAYIIATYGTVLLDASTILGPPPGHPDYSANFIPNVGYTRLEDTMVITTTTTAPNNTTNIELARVTLTAGQTTISSVVTTFQVLSSVNAKSVVMAGDVTGSSGANTISNLQGKPVAASNPATGNVLQWNGTNWVPVGGNFGPIGPAGGDLTGSYPNPTVAQSSASPAFTVLNTLNVNGQSNLQATSVAGEFLTPQVGIETSGYMDNRSGTWHIDQSGNTFFAGSMSNSGSMTVGGAFTASGLGLFNGALDVNGLLSAGNTGGYIGGIQMGPAFTGTGHITSITGTVAIDNPVTISGSNSITVGGGASTMNGLTVNNTVTCYPAGQPNQATTLNQTPISNFSNGYVRFSGTNTELSAQVILTLQWGFQSWVGLSAATVCANGGSNWPISFPFGFGTTCLWAGATFGTDDFSGAGAMVARGIVLEVGSLSTGGMNVFADFISFDGQFIGVSISPGGLTGFYWVAIGY